MNKKFPEPVQVKVIKIEKKIGVWQIGKEKNKCTIPDQMGGV